MSRRRLAWLALPAAVIAGGVAGALLFGGDSRRAAGGLDVRRLNGAARASVVELIVLPHRRDRRYKKPFDTGTGVAIGDGRDILTAAHVVALPAHPRAREALAGFRRRLAAAVYVKTASGHTYPARVVGCDVGADLALVRLPRSAPPLPALRLATTARPAVGTQLALASDGDAYRLALGDVASPPEPFVADHLLTPGVLPVDLAVVPGASGGPALDSRGTIAGIALGSDDPSGRGFGYISPAGLVGAALERMRRYGRRATPPLVRLRLAMVTSDVARRLHLPAGQGVLVERVLPGGPRALHGGHRHRRVLGRDVTFGGDQIVKVDGRSVSTVDDVLAAIARHRAGQRLRVAFFRRRARHSAALALHAAPRLAPPT